ncbi:MAG: copper amine oxidase N-terminal domain-containing protein, partial [Symbiobacteriaceae bacterium]|nr:copper amine oxidase N-terminal domain-containing protein [Symbiobacteriaceae bacterium]
MGRKRLTWETKGYHLPVLIALVVLLTATGSLWQQSAKGATLIDGGYQPPNPRRYGGQSPPALTGASLLRLGSRGGVEAFVYHTLGESSSWASTLSASIYVDGEELSLTDPAVLIEGRVLVPIRGLMEALQAVVEWEPNLRTVSITRDKVSTLKLWTDNRLFFYRDAATTYYGVCDVAPRIINDKTYLPLRMVAEALGISIEWDEMGRRIIIDTAKALATKPDHDLSILGVNSGQRITDSMNLKLSFEPGGQPEGETPTRYFLLDPATGTGKLIAMSASVNEAVSWLPDLTLNGKTGILAAIILDKQGLFLRGTAVEVHLEVTPRVALQGITPNQQMTGETTMSVQTNFHTRGVEYEFTEISSGSSTRSILTDPSGIYTHVPPAGQTGLIAVRAIAFDAAGNPITSEQIILQAQVPEEDSTPYVKLHNFAIADVGKVPVTLSISRNFDAHSTQYWARSVNSSVEVLLAEMPWGDYQWFPGPDTAGEWDILVKVIAPDGKIHTSNPIRVTVPATPGILLRGAGPGQVITGELRLSSLANVPLTRVEYRLQNLGDGSYISVGLAESSAHEVVFTPRQAYEGERRLQAIGTMADGTTIIDEFTVRIYLG